MSLPYLLAVLGQTQGLPLDPPEVAVRVVSLAEGDPRVVMAEELEALHVLDYRYAVEDPMNDIYDTFGEVVAGLGDLDGDGHDDFAAGPRHLGIWKGNTLPLFSGRTGEVLDVLRDPFMKGSDCCGVDYAFLDAVSMGDLDGDGRPELAVSTPLDSGFFDATGGRVRIYSGATREIRFELDPETDVDGFGDSLACAGDLNGDGVADLLIGSTSSSSVCSGTDGECLMTLPDYSCTEAYFGSAVCAGRDFSGDGVGDLVVGSPFDGDDGSEVGAVWIFSGADGSRLDAIFGSTPRGHFGASLDWVGDLDGDGLSDLVVGAPGADGGRALLISSRSRGPLRRWVGTDRVARFGSCVRGGPDLDGDRVPDILVGAPGHCALPGSMGAVFALSGAKGEVLVCIAGPRKRSENEPDEAFGEALDITADVNADGVVDLLIGCPRDPHPEASFGGRVYVLSGRRLAGSRGR